VKASTFKVWLVALSAPLGLAACGVNTIPTDEGKAQAAWANVQAEDERRADLVPNLVATVQGEAQQERIVLTQVTQARAQATHVSVDASTVTDPAKFQAYQQAQDQLNGVLGHLLSITENYPDLKSNQNFLALQSQLEGSENRIAISRRDYNEAVRVYNTDLHTFPGVIWAGTIYKSEKPMQEFSATTAAQAAPTVSLPPPAQ
jgi:LemA protein